MTGRRAAVLAGRTTALIAGFLALVAAEVALARRTVGAPNDPAPRTSGYYGHSLGEPIHLATMGDSTIAGVGVPYAHETMPAIVAAGLSALAGRPVLLTNVGVSGARSSGLESQLRRVLTDPPDVALIVIGGNDVTRFVPPRRSAAQLGAVVASLTEREVDVVVGTCPDLGTVRPVLPPLRQIGWLLSRLLARAQTIATVEAGGRAVSLGSLLGPAFAVDPAMWSADRFHPSADGYAAAASVLLPSVATAVGALPDVAGPVAPDKRLPIGAAATAAVAREGSEVREVREAPGRSIRRPARVRVPARLRPTRLLGRSEAPRTDAPEGQQERRNGTEAR